MKKKTTLNEELRRIHELTYGKEVLNEQNFFQRLFGKKDKSTEPTAAATEPEKKIDDPKKADLVSDDVNAFYKNIEDAIKAGGLVQQSGGITYQKEVESMQIGLQMLGYELPRFGVDGLFGGETAAAVSKFISEKLGGQSTGTTINEAANLTSAGGGSLIGYPGQGTHSAEGWPSHNAWDVAAPVGTEVYSITNGTVVGFIKGDGTLKKSGVKKIYGDQVKVQSNDGKPDVFYTHIDSSLQKGSNVKEGDVIGKIISLDGMPSHVHVGLSSGNLADYANGLTKATGGSGGSPSATPVKATPEMLTKLLELLKAKPVTSEELKKHIDSSVSNIGKAISLSGTWVDITKELLRKHEGFIANATWDENAYRGGYGSDKKLVNGRLENATQSTTWTRQEAEDTMDYEIKNSYGPIVAKQLGMDNWNKLNDKQKASLVSLGYNAGPYFITARDYGRQIKSAIEKGDMETAAQYIERGPTTGAGSGRVYAGLQRRRKEESQVFMS